MKYRKDGFTEVEIAELLNPKNTAYFRGAPYWTSELYGFGKYIREYGYYPRFLPLCIYSDHGVSYYLEPNQHELHSGSPAQFFHSPESVANWKQVSDVPCYNLYSPFVFYRQSRRITQSPTAEGTLAFPAHSTPSIENQSHFEQYIQDLESLPDTYKPISICLHMHDINKGLHTIFLDNGYPVFTAGNTHNYAFTEQFYEILRHFKYTTSNFIGSYTFYAVEMGIPFFVYGSRETFINVSDSNLPKGEFDPYKTHPRFKQMYDLFDSPTTSISAHQKEVVERTLGLYDGVSRITMAIILYRSLLAFIFSRRVLKWMRCMYFDFHQNWSRTKMKQK